MKDFAAIDFETANSEMTSVCAVGIVVVREGKVFDEFFSLIKPEPEYYSYWCTRVHGLTLEDTRCAQVFPRVWEQVEPLIAGLPLVAHNKRFDENCLKSVFRCYQRDYPDYPFYCTYLAARRRLPHLPNHRLPTVAEAVGFELTHHHHALWDAHACAAIALRLL